MQLQSMWTLSRGGSSGPRKTKHSRPLKKTCVSPSGNWQGTSVPWRKLSDGRESVLSTLPSGSSFFTFVEVQKIAVAPIKRDDASPEPGVASGRRRALLVVGVVRRGPCARVPAEGERQ